MQRASAIWTACKNPTLVYFVPLSPEGASREDLLLDGFVFRSPKIRLPVHPERFELSCLAAAGLESAVYTIPPWVHAYGIRDSNPYVFRHKDLNLAWLPISPIPHI